MPRPGPMMRVCRRGAVGGVLLVVLLAACSSASSGAEEPSPRRQLVQAIDRDLEAHPRIPGEAVSVRAPGLQVEAARGYANVATKAPLRASTPFRIASVTKTFVAVALLRLMEEGKVELDAPIARYLAPDTVALLRGGGYEPGLITVRQLLNHTGGLFDYAGSAAYDAVNVSDPGHHWTRREQLEFAMTHGRPVAAPGAKYHYSDTGYILLGEIIERASGQPLARAVRDTVGFERLGLDHTYWEALEPTPAALPARAHQYYDRTFDNIALDASSDLYGGGGLVSTVGDLTRFFRALFDGRIFDHDATLATMTDVSEPGRRAGAALGLFAADIAGVKCFGHPGYWGTEAYSCPELSMAFALETNQANEAALDTTSVEATIVKLTRAAAGG